MMISGRENQASFYAKILLFGEYSVIFDSMGLSIPYTHFKGELSFINEDKYTDLEFAIESQQHLRGFYNWLVQENPLSQTQAIIDTAEFGEDIKKGIYFESSIPQGYGIGSSGALVAAIYDRYAKHKIPSTRNLSLNDINQLKDLFSKLESYFHGMSSGLDPLNSYLKYPVLINGKKDISVVGIPRNKHEKEAAVFLIDTGKTGKTSPLVNWFISQCEKKEFKSRIENELIKYNNNCVTAMVEGDSTELFSNLKKLSTFQLEVMKPMIPEYSNAIWRKGLDTESFYLKLCGSGGGGFLLGFTENLHLCKQILQEFDESLIPVYRN